MKEDSNEQLENAGPGAFRTTHWSLVVQAADGEISGSAQALERLCQTYWYPIYAFVRRRGHSREEAQDLTQGFFEKLLAKDYLGDADRQKGRFRTFLLTSLSHFLANQWDRSQAKKRGGHVQFVSLEAAAEAEERYGHEPADDVTAESIYEQRWAHSVVARVIDRLATEVDEERFEALKGFLTGEDPGSYAAVAAQLGLSVAAVTSAIHRMRTRFGALLREEIRETVAHPGEVDDEIRHLLSVLTQ